MFQLQKQSHIIEISSENHKVFAAINLNEGGRLFDLKLNDKQVISEYPGFPYDHSSASAIMFPFVNRVEDGKYNFEGESYQLFCNDVEKNNAIHGLLYTRKFEVFDKLMSSESAFVTLRYRYDGSITGFPFPFDFFVTYTITENTLNVQMKVVNTGTKTFPFTIGWHPYFNSESLPKSTIDFDCNIEYTTTDDRSLTNGTTPHTLKMPFLLENNAFDTAYELATSIIEFVTPTYKATLQGSATTNYVQFYTPANKSIIAIEPTVGLSNSFNNGIGLLTLAPQKMYEIDWTVVIQ